MEMEKMASVQSRAQEIFFQEKQIFGYVVSYKKYSLLAI